MKKMFVFIIILVCLFSAWTLTFAAAESSFFKGLNTTAGQQGAGYQSMPKGGASAFIANLLGRFIAPVLAGVIGMLLLAYGGFIWMMSRGREQEIERAKIIITNTLIAMIVILSVWAIVQLVMPLWKLVTENILEV